MRGVLITGGSGSFGTAFATHLLRTTQEPLAERIIVYSRGEHRQAEMARQLAPLDPNNRMRYFVGDIRDRDRLRRAMLGVQLVIHAAALKRIEVGHYNPLEVKKTNIDGAANVVEAAIDSGVARVIALSTDKAYHPVSPYGTSKAFAESLFLAANNTTGWHGTQFAAVRYGNVWGSAGSVVPTWRRIIAQHIDGMGQGEHPTVPVTDPECTRFYMTLDQAVQLVWLTANAASLPTDVVIPELPAYRLGDLAEAMGAQMRITGLPAWEKRHESMGPGNSSDKARRMSVEELREALK